MIDYDKIREFAPKFFALSPWGDCELDLDAVCAAIASLAENPQAYVEVTDKGAMAGLLVPLWFAPRTLLASELFWYSEEKGEGRRLREGFEAWARERGARFSQIPIMTNDSEGALRRMMERAGYTARELGLTKEL